MLLERQLERLRECGIALSDGVSVDDLLDAWPRDRYETEPFRLLITWLGAEIDREPWVFSPHVLTFDCECIDDGESYVSLIDDICDLASAKDYVTEVSASIDFENDVGRITCKIDGKQHKWDVEIRRDWADTIALAKIMAKIKRNGKHFYKIEDDGQSLTLLYLNHSDATTLAELSNQTMTPMAKFAG